jgi:hypothetical protein
VDTCSIYEVFSVPNVFSRVHNNDQKNVFFINFTLNHNLLCFHSGNKCLRFEYDLTATVIPEVPKMWGTPPPPEGAVSPLGGEFFI